MKKVFNWIIDKWLAGFITASIYFSLKIYIDLPDEKKANFFNFSWLSAILNYQIPIWQVSIVCTLFILVIVFKKKIKYIDRPIEPYYKPENNGGPLMNYTLDVFGSKNRLWTWELKWDEFKQTRFIRNVYPCCPVCDNKLTETYNNRIGLCRICRLEDREKYQFEITEIADDVTEAIISRCDNDTWLSANQRIKLYREKRDQTQ